jgi:tocopherol O-methyltransferase
MLLKDKIVQHYDELSPYYKDLWGVHIHHGFWNTATKTKEEAQEQLIRELIFRAEIENGARILDVGCGLGGTAIYLNKALGANVTGITIFPVQIDIANNLARNCDADIRLVLMDAENIG